MNIKKLLIGFIVLSAFSFSIEKSIFNGIITSQSGVVEIEGILSLSQVSKTADYTASTEQIIICDATSGAITITLPAVSSGLQYTIKKTDSSANAVTIDGASSETIDGELTQLLTTQYDVITIVSDGTTWHTL